MEPNHKQHGFHLQCGIAAMVVVFCDGCEAEWAPPVLPNKLFSHTALMKGGSAFLGRREDFGYTFALLRGDKGGSHI